MKKRCKAAVYKRDEYRRTGRGSSGFEMHYTKDQCSRVAVVDDLCTQHAKMVNLERVDWFEHVE